MDLLDKPHVGKGFSTGLVMEHLTLIGKSMPIYEGCGDPLKIRISVDVSTPLDDVRFRLTLRTDTDEAVGTAWTKPYRVTSTGKMDIDFSLSLDMFERGSFYASIGFYYTDNFGRIKRLDHITRAFQIEISPKYTNPFWHARSQGYIKLPEISIETQQDIAN
jgi:hypothetical protein